MDIVVQHAELIPGPALTGVWKISADLTRDGETERYGTIMPADTLAWRVAQFNCTPAQAMEMILVEPFITHDQLALDHLPTRSQARDTKLAWVREALDGGTITWAEGPPEWSVSEGAERVVVAESGDANPLEFILEHQQIDDDIIDVMRERMDLTREGVRQAKAEPPALRHTTAEELRARLLPEPPTEVGQPSGPIEAPE